MSIAYNENISIARKIIVTVSFLNVTYIEEHNKK